ncbi:MAG: Sec-independent protein translocase protein TatB [Erythrobacter sp.]
MFDLGAAELLVIVVVAIIVIGPKDMPLALRTAGKWIGKVRKVSSHFRSGLDTMVREAELEEMEEKWKTQNEAIMAGSSDEMTGPPMDLGYAGENGAGENVAGDNLASTDETAPASAEAALAPAPKKSTPPARDADNAEPQLPLGADNPPKPRIPGQG